MRGRERIGMVGVASEYGIVESVEVGNRHRWFDIVL